MDSGKKVFRDRKDAGRRLGKMLEEEFKDRTTSGNLQKDQRIQERIILPDATLRVVIIADDGIATGQPLSL